MEHAALVDAPTLTELEKIARESGWTNDDAQSALESHVVRVSAKRQELRQSLEADPTYGGQQTAETERLARIAIDHIRPEGHTRRQAFTALLHSGVGFIHHPEVLGFLADLGRLIGEDSPGHRTPGSAPSLEGTPLEDRLWPKK